MLGVFIINYIVLTIVTYNNFPSSVNDLCIISVNGLHGKTIPALFIDQSSAITLYCVCLKYVGGEMKSLNDTDFTSILDAFVNLSIIGRY